MLKIPLTITNKPLKLIFSYENLYICLTYNSNTKLTSNIIMNTSKSNSNLFDCIVFGEIIYDIYQNTHQLGGAPLIYSWYLSQFGLKVLFISSLGRDLLGQKAIQKIKSSNLISYSIELNNLETGTAHIIGSSTNPEFIINENVAWDQIILPPNISTYKSQALYFGTLSQRSKFNQHSLKRLFRLTHQYQMFDINLRKNYYSTNTIEYGLNNARIVKMNKTEFNLIKELLNISSYHELLDNYDIETLLVTNADKQVDVVNRNKALHVIPPKSNAKDTIGAGDAFFAAFTVGVIKNLELEYIVAKSCEIASYITERKGALIDLPENLKYFE